MRKQFIEVETLEEARDEAPWACAITRVEGGFRAFESWSDYQLMVNQSDDVEAIEDDTWRAEA